ncbi:MAG: hypothetical protein F6K26_33075 [Moorea sp. SIO2I5]|nr:hypothetical protein [Moorena sp. SIO2I5]
MVLIEAESTRVRKKNVAIEDIKISENETAQVVKIGSNLNNDTIQVLEDPVGEAAVVRTPLELEFDWKKNDGPVGKYDISIAYFDEEDGESKLTFQVNENTPLTYVFDLNLPSSPNNQKEPTAEASNYVPLTGKNSSNTLEVNPNHIFENVDLAPGNTIKILVEANSNGKFTDQKPRENKDFKKTFELGRIDAIEITRAPSVDLFWHNPDSEKSEKVELWTLTEQDTKEKPTKLMKDQHFIKDKSGQEVLVPDNAGLEARGVIDLGDGNRSPLWRDTLTGGVVIWKMEGSEFQEEIIIDPPAGGPGSDLNWEIRGTGDVNGGGAEEIFWYNTSTGDIAVWEIDENGSQEATNITTNGENMIESPNSSWELVAAGDMDKDGDADAIWQHKQDKTFGYWELEGTVYQKAVELDLDPGNGPWEFRGAYDTYGDGVNDFYFLSEDGQTGMWMIDENQLNGNIFREDIVLMDTFEDTNFSFYV